MRISLNLLESDSQIRSLILNSIISQLKQTIAKSIPKINNDLKILVKQALKEEPEYQSLVGGKLRAEFGIPDSNSVDSVVEALGNTLEITQSPLVAGPSGIKGGFILYMMKSSDMGGIIYTDIASSIDSKGYSIPWLEWLLLKNNQILVKNYEVRYTNSSRSRSGMALMYHSDSNWRVPPEFAGSITNNWTTRAVDRIESKVYDTIKKHIENNI
jgi:hypothetical protein